MGSCVHQLISTAMPRASFVVRQGFLFPVDGQAEEAFVVNLDQGGANGRRRGKRGRVLRIEDTAIGPESDRTAGEGEVMS